MIREVLAAAHLPLYHLTLRVRLLAGESEAWIRLPSAIAGMGTIVFTYLAAREIFSRRVALWSAALVAVSPYLVFYSRATTFYAFMIAQTGLLTDEPVLAQVLGRSWKLEREQDYDNYQLLVYRRLDTQPSI